LSFIPDIISILPVPWNYITIFVLLSIFILVVVLGLYVITRVVRTGVKIGNVDIKGSEIKPAVKMLTLTEETVDKLFRLFISTLSSTMERSKNKRMSDKMDYAVGKLGSIYTVYKKTFFKLVEEKGIDKRIIINHDDYITFDLSLRTALYLQNGVDCYKSVIKTELRDGFYNTKEGSEYEEFIKNMGMRFNTIFSKAFEGAYKNASFYGDSQEQIYRLVSVEEVFKIFDVTWPMIKDDVRDIFDNAKKIDIILDKLEKEKMDESIEAIKTYILGGN
jgi:hypothetical protein